MRNGFLSDTIAAVATAEGMGGIAIVRASGDGAPAILDACFRPAFPGRAMAHARLTYGHVVDENGEVLDEAMAVRFFAPKSYTREDVIELQCHGGRACADAVLRLLLHLGARAAEPGEFTRRAFMNGRIDLSEAEAVMALVGARSRFALRASVRQLQGGVSSAVGRAREELTKLISLIDASCDFPEEIDEPAAAKDVLRRALSLKDALLGYADEKTARIAREGASVVLIGRPNAGKSSVMNALLSAERAIVTEYPGTTRDVLTESVEFSGLRLSLSDTAGLRDTSDPIEKIGVSRAMEAKKLADCVVLVLDASLPISPEDEALLAEADERYVIALNKCDLPVKMNAEGVRVSARTGSGIRELSERILRVAGADAASECAMMLPRHIECARRAVSAIERAASSLSGGFPLDFAAADLSEALEALGDITGETMNERVIDRVFADFCVGK